MYRIDALVGAGGMGEVYRAHDTRLGREVAIKTIAPKLAGEPAALAQFQREAQTIAALSHPNILAIYDIGNDDGVWFLVTELLGGETLGQRLSRGAFTWRTSVDIVSRRRGWLERGYEDRGGAVYRTQGSFLFASLRAHPRFKALLRKMNLE